MDRDAASAGDKACNRLAWQGITATGKANHHVADARHDYRIRDAIARGLGTTLSPVPFGVWLVSAR